MVEASAASAFDAHFIYKELYVAYTLINTGSLLEEPGLIKRISSIFSEESIPIMYTTTYNNNYLLVPKAFEARADRLVEL